MPAGTEVSLAVDGAITVKGKLGELTLAGDHNLDMSVDGSRVSIKRKRDNNHARSIEGTFVRRIESMITGVSEGCSRSLELHGTGFRATLNGRKLDLELGFSHPVVYELPEDIKAELPAPNRIVISGFDKVKVGQVASDIRRFRPPEPYKGKGARYAGEHIVRKETKKK